MAVVLKESTFLKDKKVKTHEEIHEIRQEKNELMKQKKGFAFRLLLRKWERFALLGFLAYLAKGVSEDLFYLALFGFGVAVVLTIGYTKRPYEEEARKVTDRIYSKIRKDEPWRKGLKGETTVEQALSKLPNDYYIIHDVVLNFKRRVQIDHVVVGPTGIFAIETKSMGGNLRPHPEGWLQGSKLIKSPQTQSIQGALILSSLTLQRVQPLVALSNPQAKWLGGKDKDCPVLYSNKLVMYILSQPRTITNQYEIAQEILKNLAE